HRRERWRAVAVVALGAVVLGAGIAVAAAWREQRVQTHPLRAVPAGMSVRVVVTPVDDPKPVRAATFGDERTWLVRANLQKYQHGSTIVRSGGAVVILATGSAWAKLPPGQPIEFRARVSPPRLRDLTVATLRALGDPATAGALPWWQRFAGSVRADLVAASAAALPAGAAGSLPALVVGDTSALSDDVRRDFETAGLTHLTVVSGANFTILLTVVLFLTRLLTLGPRMTVAVAAGALVMFVVIARPDPSVLRAAAMGAVTLLALLTGRRRQALPALCAAVIGLLAVWPQLAMSAGFALSVLATGALILLAPSWSDWLRANGMWRLPAEILAVSAAAFVVTTPIVVALTGKISLVAVIANVLVAPVIAPITVIGAAGAVLASAWMPLAELALRCAAPPMWWMLSVAEYLAAIPGATVTVPGGSSGGLIACAVVAAVIWLLRSVLVRRLVAVVLISAGAVLIPVRWWFPGWPPDGWVLAACDVGQGDGLAVATGPRSAVVVDVGPEPRAIRTCLDRLGITRVPLLVLSHPHADHIAGLEGALDGREIGAVAIGPGELPAHRVGPASRRSGQASGEAMPTRCGRALGTTGNLGAPVHNRESGIQGGDGEHHDSRHAGPAEVAQTLQRAGIPLTELTAGCRLTIGDLVLDVLAPSAPRSSPHGSAGSGYRQRPLDRPRRAYGRWAHPAHRRYRGRDSALIAELRRSPPRRHPQGPPSRVPHHHTRIPARRPPAPGHHQRRSRQHLRPPASRHPVRPAIAGIHHRPHRPRRCDRHHFRRCSPAHPRRGPRSRAALPCCEQGPSPVGSVPIGDGGNRRFYKSAGSRASAILRYPASFGCRWSPES
ncbi:MBL fold metallo-hydrolase, partial [Nocardia cyriacigeorgica]